MELKDLICNCGYVAKNETHFRLHKLSCGKEVKSKKEVAQKQAETPIVDEKNEKTTITLRNAIIINGKEYSGTVEVDSSLAKELLYRDDLRNESEARITKNINNTQTYLGDIKG